MAELILHHYALSPFSEKIRAMLGYGNLSWHSVITREVPPRPLLNPLTGGYRKIPVAQIGADIFCDSRTIASEIAALSGKPELALEHCTKKQQAYIQEVDLELFFACAMAASTLTMGHKFFNALSVPDLARFIWDRANLGRTASVKSLSPGAARKRVIEHLSAVEKRLKQPFLFGAKPNHADFSTYHSLWFIRHVAESSLVDEFAKTCAWMQRIEAFGHGKHRELSAAQALDIAKQASPRPIAASHQIDPRIGQWMQIAPSDYGQTPTTGKLIGVTDTTWILARQQEQVGTVHVHFPQQGFRLTPSNP